MYFIVYDHGWDDHQDFFSKTKDCCVLMHTLKAVLDEYGIRDN